MRDILRSLNQRPVAFYPIYARGMDSISCAVALSQLMYWFSTGKDKIYKTDAELQDETGMSDKEIRTVKKKLKELHFLTITREGVPAKTYYEIDWNKYQSSMSQWSKLEKRLSKEERKKFERDNPVCTIGTDSAVPKGGTITESTQRLPDNTSSVATKVDDEASDEKEISETMAMAIAVGDHLVQKLSESIETYKPPTPAKMKGWYRDIERAIRLDGRTQEQLISVIDWIHDGSGTFWIANIKSGKKLRDQFDTLWFQMHESAPKVNVRQRALADFGLGNVFYKYKDVANNRIVSVCIYGDYGSLYDYNGNKYISKDVADKLWKHIEKDYDQILAEFQKDHSAKLSA